MNKFEEEQKHLDYSLECIDEQIKKAKDKNVKLMAEGVSLSYEDTKRGEHLNIGAMMGFYEDIIKKLKNLIPSPYFGRFDYCAEGEDKPLNIYIGKSTVMDNGKFVITDWRTPICSLYYDSEIGPVEYESPNGIMKGRLDLKRQIDIKNSQLIDVIDSDLVTNDDLLNKYLNVNADNKMKTIIESIQKEQNQIIRRPVNDNIIVQGVAGSGKTSVALHRIAYLIYNLGDSINSNQFLVLGPNNYFLNYISSILPELETEPVEQKTLLNLANEYLNEKFLLSDSNNIKINQQQTIEKIQSYKSSQRYKCAIDNFMDCYMNSGIVSEDFILDNEIIYTKEEIIEVLFSGATSYPNFDKAYKYFLTKFKENLEEIYEKLNQKYREVYINLPKEHPERKKAIEKSGELYNLVKKEGIKKLKNYFIKLQVKPIDLYKVFVANLSNFDSFLSDIELETLQKNTLIELKKKKISFEDIPALLHINYQLTGNKIKYKHIVIDEAQDYGLFHFDAIKQISPNSTFSIYGDLAQAIYSHRSVDSWESVNKNTFNNSCEILNLSKSYRTTIEVTNNANQILNQLNLTPANPVIRHGNKVEFLEDFKNSNFKVNKIKQWLNNGYKTIAIICKTEQEAKKVYSELINQGVNIKYISAKDEQYSGGVFVLTSASAKGLEFDCVIINDASSNIYSDQSKKDMHLLYVACTRALHEQIILYKNELTNVFNKNVQQVDNHEKVKKFIK